MRMSRVAFEILLSQWLEKLSVAATMVSLSRIEGLRKVAVVLAKGHEVSWIARRRLLACMVATFSRSALIA